MIPRRFQWDTVDWSQDMAAASFVGPPNLSITCSTISGVIMQDYMTSRHYVNGETPVASYMILRHAFSMSDFGKWLKANRENCDSMSQEVLGDHLGVTQSTIAKWETGDRIPRNYEGVRARAEQLFRTLNAANFKDTLLDDSGSIGEHHRGNSTKEDVVDDDDVALAVTVLRRLSPKQRNRAIAIVLADKKSPDHPPAARAQT